MSYQLLIAMLETEDLPRIGAHEYWFQALASES